VGPSNWQGQDFSLEHKNGTQLAKPYRENIPAPGWSPDGKADPLIHSDPTADISNARKTLAVILDREILDRAALSGR
jgi:hypothetical protein